MPRIKAIFDSKPRKAPREIWELHTRIQARGLTLKRSRSGKTFRVKAGDETIVELDSIDSIRSWLKGEFLPA